jgi:hypothetical protein
MTNKNETNKCEKQIPPLRCGMTNKRVLRDGKQMREADSSLRSERQANETVIFRFFGAVRSAPDLGNGGYSSCFEMVTLISLVIILPLWPMRRDARF